MCANQELNLKSLPWCTSVLIVSYFGTTPNSNCCLIHSILHFSRLERWENFQSMESIRSSESILLQSLFFSILFRVKDLCFNSWFSHFLFNCLIITFLSLQIFWYKLWLKKNNFWFYSSVSWSSHWIINEICLSGVVLK